MQSRVAVEGNLRTVAVAPGSTGSGTACSPVTECPAAEAGSASGASAQRTFWRERRLPGAPSEREVKREMRALTRADSTPRAGGTGASLRRAGIRSMRAPSAARHRVTGTIAMCAASPCQGDRFIALP